MSNTVLCKNYSAMPISVREILRYAGCKSADEQTSALVNECLREIENKLVYKVCFAEFDVTLTQDTVDFGFSSVISEKLASHMKGTDKAVVFAATVGLETDRLIKKYSALSPSKALMFQAIGAERVEALCDTFCEDIKNDALTRGYITKTRFSPGYGDLKLSVQRDIFKVLDCAKHIGADLNDNLLITPSKSVTAIIGLSPMGA